MLGTNVQEIMSQEELETHVAENDAIVVCAGRMGPMCIPVYGAMEQMEKEEQFGNVKFMTVDFDTAAAIAIINADKCHGFMGLPFTVYYKNGQMVHATSSLQSRTQLEESISGHLV